MFTLEKPSDGCSRLLKNCCRVSYALISLTIASACSSVPDLKASITLFRSKFTLDNFSMALLPRRADGRSSGKSKTHSKRRCSHGRHTGRRPSHYKYGVSFRGLG